MKTATLKAIDDPVTGEIGWIVAGSNIGDEYPQADYDGTIVAHDLLEHVNGLKEIGTLGDELEALGASWYVRGQFGYFRRGESMYYSTEEGLSRDVGRICEQFLQGVDFGIPVPRTRSGDEPASLEYIAEEGARQGRDEYTYSGDELPRDRYREFKRAALHFLRTGYRKAQKRYPISAEVNDLFFAIVDEVKRLGRPDFEGEVRELRYELSSGRVSIDYPEEEFY